MTLTTARRHQLKLNDLFIRGHINCKLSYGVEASVMETEAHALVQEFGWSDISKIKKVSWALASSARYKENSVIVNKVESHNVHFASIRTVYVYCCSKVAFKAQQLETFVFDEHLYAYQVRVPDYNDDLAIYIKYEDLHHRNPCNLPVVGYDTPPESYVILRKPL